MMLFFYILVSVLSLCFCESNRTHFRAAILEHRVRGNVTTQKPEEVITQNLNIFVKAAEVAASMDADIIVFSEYGLFTSSRDRKVLKKFTEHVPDPQKSKHNPCNEKELFEKRPILYTLSCMAQKHQMYVVANMADIQPCSQDTCSAHEVDGCQDQNCPSDGNFLYNTDVAFNREGELIARYHKTHPYVEIVNSRRTPEYVTFETDFGVCGLIICFDSVFKTPVNLVENHNVETLIYTTHWYDDILPLNAIEFQQSWALNNKVNFIAANCHKPGLGTLGSGIYSKEYGALAYTYFPNGNSKLLVADVPRDTTLSAHEFLEDEVEPIVITEDSVWDEEEDYEDFPLQCYEKLVGPPQNNFTDYRCYKSQTSKYTLVKLEQTSGRLESCNNGLCCSVSYEADSMDEDYYLAAFNGTNDIIGYYKWAEESCLLVRCDALDDSPCVTFPSKAKTVFKTVTLEANFSTKYVYPTVSYNHFRLASKQEWDYEKKATGSILQLNSKSEDKPLLKVGLLGRCYDRDPPYVPYFKE